MEADLVLVLHHEVQKPPELVGFPLQIGVEQRLVAFAAAPQHVVLAAEFVRDVERGPHLGRGPAEHVRVGIGRRPAHETTVREQIGRAPEQLDLGTFHLAPEQCGDLAGIAVRFGKRRTLGGDVAVVEAEIRDIEQPKQLERHVSLLARAVQRVAARHPGPLERIAAKRVGAGPT